MRYAYHAYAAHIDALNIATEADHNLEQLHEDLDAFTPSLALLAPLTSLAPYGAQTPRHPPLPYRHRTQAQAKLNIWPFNRPGLVKAYKFPATHWDEASALHRGLKRALTHESHARAKAQALARLRTQSAFDDDDDVSQILTLKIRAVEARQGREIRKVKKTHKRVVGSMQVHMNLELAVLEAEVADWQEEVWGGKKAFEKRCRAVRRAREGVREVWREDWDLDDRGKRRGRSAAERIEDFRESQFDCEAIDESPLRKVSRVKY
ncbi:MAG: hypothetical protein MMC23_001029 [Stictis urceolatum]|nr:hypothetical protein [Stictis urceolata]